MQGVASPPPMQGVHWVQVRLSIKCMTCQRPSPLSRLDMEGRYYCYGCNREQFFDADMWKESVLFIASGLGDAMWSNVQTFPPWPPNNPDDVDPSDSDDLDDVDDEVMKHLLHKCNEIGRTTGVLTIERGGMSIGGGGMRTRGMVLAMSPGHPLCAQCKTPLQTQTPSPDGVVTTSCPRCNAHETYRVPPAAMSVCKDLCGVIAPEHVEGREAARIAPQPGSAALAVVCPKCGSGLQLAPGARITNCPYCKTTSVVPEQIAAAGGPAPTDPDPLWLAFRSPSTVRTFLIEHAQKASAEASAPKARDSDSGPSSGDKRRAEQARLAAEQSRANAAKLTTALTVVPIGIALAAFFAFRVGAFDSMLNKDKKHEGDHGAVTTPTATSKKPVRSDPVAITSCSCAFGDGQSTPKITLTVNAPPGDATRGWSLSIVKNSGFIEEESSARFPAAAGAVLPPLLDAGAPTHMGVACDTGIFVLVADKAATGWSSVSGAWKWNATLPSPSIDAADAAATASNDTSYAGGCSPLAVKNGAASLNLANGKHVSLSLKDGKIR